MENIKYRCRGMTPATYISLAVLLFAISFGWQLPPEYGTESGPLELVQVGIIILTALVSISALFQTKFAPARRQLFAITSVIWLLGAARELSWGRIFYATKTGFMPPLKTLWFGSYVSPAIAILVVGAGTYFFTKRLHKELLLWLKHGTLPVLDFGIFAVFFILADLVEHHSYGLFSNKTDLFEELAELVAYTGSLSFMINVIFSKQFRTNSSRPTEDNEAT